MHQSFATTAPPPMGKGGGQPGQSAGQLLFKSPRTAGEMTGFDIRILTPGRFSIAKSGAKSKFLTSGLPPGGGAYSRALKVDKS